MFNEIINKYHKVLLIGTGGGNDIVSTLIPQQHLQKRGIQTDIAGILSPGAIHYFNEKLEDVVNIVNSNSRRIITGKEDVAISFVDSLLPQIVKDENININKIYDFSIRYGTSKLVERVNSLIRHEKYDLVLAVDVGGDILARNHKDKYVLSPLMDFTTLYLLNHLHVDTMLLELGLGTDGELRPDGMKEILTALREDNLMLYESQISANDSEIGKFRNVFDKVKDVRAGHTNVMILKTLDSTLAESKKDIVTEYRFRSQIGKQKWLTPFEVTLPSEYAGKTYLINGKKLAEKRFETAFSYKNSLEQYVKLKSMCPEWKTELDLFSLWSGHNWTSSDKHGHSLFLLVPSTNMPEQQRNEIIKYGVENSDSDLILLRATDIKNNSDISNIIRTKRWICENADDFSVLSKHNDFTFRKTVHDIIKYQYF